MTTTIAITLLVIAAASIAINVFQFMERRMEKKEADELARKATIKELDYDALLKAYNNEKLHKEWAIGRIKDQQAVIDRLSALHKPTRPTKKPRQ